MTAQQHHLDEAAQHLASAVDVLQRMGTSMETMAGAVSRLTRAAQQSQDIDGYGPPKEYDGNSVPTTGYPSHGSENREQQGRTG